MIDRERKRQADRERRERIRNGTWKFPKGGDAEASLGLSSKTALTAQRGSPAAYTPLSPANPGPAPRSIIPEPRGAAPLSRAMAPAPAPSSSRALAIIPTPAPSMPAGRIVKRPPHSRSVPSPFRRWKDPNARRDHAMAVGRRWRTTGAPCARKTTPCASGPKRPSAPLRPQDRRKPIGSPNGKSASRERSALSPRFLE